MKLILLHYFICFQKVLFCGIARHNVQDTNYEPNPQVETTRQIKTSSLIKTLIWSVKHKKEV